MKNKLNITKGEWVASSHLSSDKTHKVNRVDSNIGIAVCIIRTNNQVNAENNAILIADAGTTYNECQILPSELLKQRNELLEALMLITYEYMNSVINTKEHIINNALQAIKNCELWTTTLNN